MTRMRPAARRALALAILAAAQSISGLGLAQALPSPTVKSLTLAPTTIAALPACASGNSGAIAAVTDSGGEIMLCNGAAWSPVAGLSIGSLGANVYAALTDPLNTAGGLAASLGPYDLQRDFGAKCDNVTDDTAAIQAWANAAAGRRRLTDIRGGLCVFKSPIIFPLADFITLDGGGLATTFVYQGAATNTTLMYMGPAAILTAGTGGAPSTTLAVTAVAGTLAPFVGMPLQPQSGIAAGVTITACPGGVCGGTGNYTLSGNVTLAAGSIVNDAPLGTSCAIKNWVVQGFRLTSTIAMTAGDGLRLAASCTTHFYDAYIGGSGVDGNTNLYNGLHFSAGNSPRFIGLTASASHIGVIVNGGTANQATDPYFGYSTIVKSGLGLDIAGNVGGFQIGHSDILSNGANVLISQDQVAVNNVQVQFGAGTAVDVTNTGLYPAASQIGIEVSDTGGSNSHLNLIGSWTASASASCIVIDSGATYFVNYTGGSVGNCHGGANGAIDNLSLTSLVTISGVRFFTSQAGGGNPTLLNAASANPIVMSGIRADANFSYSGPVGGTYFDDAGVFREIDPQATNQKSAVFDGSANSNGVNLKMIGNGVTTPNKTLRVFNGALQVIDNGYANPLLTVQDAAPVIAFYGVQAGGSTPTASGSCAVNTQTGKNTAGTFKANGACAAGTIILTFAQSAAIGWTCDAHDQTTPADALNETASSANSVTFTGTLANLDVVAFKCMGW